MRALKAGSVAVLYCAIVWAGGFAIQLRASPPPPIIRAAVSKNGRFLVVSSFELGPAESNGASHILGFKFEVTEVQSFINGKDRLTAPNRYYSDVPGNWKVEIKPSGQRWPIVSDDGKTLVLVGVSPPWPNVSLLEIYQKKGFDAALVRSYSLRDIRDVNADGRYMATDSTPQWFASGQFSFSEDGQTLLYADKEHGSFRILLSDGTITKE
jgi:hypothetical protein